MDEFPTPAALIEPGVLVRNLDAPDWGVGQVQTRVASIITVNFEERGKVTLDGRRARLAVLGGDPREGLRDL